MRFMTPIGSSINVTDRAFEQIEAYLGSRGEVRRFFGGVGGFGGGDVSSGFIFVTMKDPGERPVDPKSGRRLTQQEFMDVVRRDLSRIPGVRVALQDPSQQGFASGRGFPVEVSIRGPDWDTLAEWSRHIMDRLAQENLLPDADSDYRVGMPEVRVLPDRNKAADLGVSMADIGDTINAAIGGARVGKFKDAGRRFDIRVRLLATERERPEDINRLLVHAHGATARRLADLEVKECVVKNGPMPAIVYAGGKFAEVAAVAHGKAIDTSGAGDAFNGAYLAARLQGQDSIAAAQFAHRVAALAIGVRGALTPFDTLKTALTAQVR